MTHFGEVKKLRVAYFVRSIDTSESSGFRALYLLYRNNATAACPFYFHVLCSLILEQGRNIDVQPKSPEVYCISFKLVKSKSSDLPHGLPLHVSQKDTV